MEIQIKSTKLTKSKIQQMDYMGIPKNPNVEVLGWVNMDKKKWVIVKFIESYYRAEFITKVEKEVKGTQFSDGNRGWIFPDRTHISCETFNKGRLIYGADIDEEKNLKLYDELVSFKRKIERAGQIYY